MANWNLTYRPQTVAELHLKNVREQLQAMLKAGSLPQVFTFAGPKGTGKTSTARILGALVNNPHNEVQIKSLFFNKKPDKKPLVDEVVADEQFQKIFQGSSYVVNEMDAASNRGIDDVRALKEKAYLPPSYGLISVYILDEAHMLTTEAFNALLKLLEEPPAHALFILATTEAHKLPETILSRSQVIQFRKASSEELMTALKNIITREKITYEDDALQAIVSRADGSFRDAVKLLQTVAQVGSVTMETLEKSGFSNIETHITDLIHAVLEKDVSKVVAIFLELRTAHVQEIYFHTALLARLHTALLQDLGIKEGIPLVTFDVAKFLLTELSASSLSQPSPLPLLQLEMKLLDIISRAQKKTPPKVGTNSNGSSAKTTSGSKVTGADSKPAVMQATILERGEPAILASTPIMTMMTTYEDKADGTILLDKWLDFVAKVADTNATLAALLRSARPVEARDGHITVKVFYKFHQEQLIQTKFNLIIRACAEEMLGGSIEFTFIVEEPVSPISNVADVTDITDLSSVAAQALM